MPEDEFVHRAEVHPDERELRAQQLDRAAPGDRHDAEEHVSAVLATDWPPQRQREAFDSASHPGRDHYTEHGDRYPGAVADLGGRDGTTCAVVVTYNRKALLTECLQALGAQTRAPDEILVVDNASTDGTAAMVREHFPDVRLEALDTNRGGAGGFHHGLDAAHRRGHA